MDLNAFYGFFSATCFTLVGLWWNVVQQHPDWMRVQELRRAVGGVYLAFFLPAVMGLFAQIGGVETPAFWRVSFVVVAVVGCVSTVRLFALTRDGGPSAAPYQIGSALIYAVVAVVGVAPTLAKPLGVTPLQTEAVLLILLIVLAHGLVWEFMRREAVAVEG